jgi:hypothetical protein
LSPQQQQLQERLKEIHDSECCDGYDSGLASESACCGCCMVR